MSGTEPSSTEPSSTEPRWLDEDEEATWLRWVFTTKLLWEELERDLQRDAGIPFGYYEILVWLSGAPERRLRMNELADATQSSRSRLSHAIARLEAEGWVRRERCPEDRRGAHAVLTDEGFAALAAAAPAHVESVRTHLLDQLSPEQQRQLREVFDALLDHLSPLAEARGDTRAAFLERARGRHATAATPAPPTKP
jgi:DNA-binding MarR family transcriptional regulator